MFPPQKCKKKIIFFLTVSIQSKHRDEKGRKKAIANYFSQWPQKTMPVFSANYFSFFVTDPKHSSLTRRHFLAGVFIPSHGKAEGIRGGALFHTS